MTCMANGMHCVEEYYTHTVCHGRRLCALCCGSACTTFMRLLFTESWILSLALFSGRCHAKRACRCDYIDVCRIRYDGWCAQHERACARVTMVTMPPRSRQLPAIVGWANKPPIAGRFRANRTQKRVAMWSLIAFPALAFVNRKTINMLFFLSVQRVCVVCWLCLSPKSKPVLRPSARTETALSTTTSDDIQRVRKCCLLLYVSTATHIMR